MSHLFVYFFILSQLPKNEGQLTPDELQPKEGNPNEAAKKSNELEKTEDADTR